MKISKMLSSPSVAMFAFITLSACSKSYAPRLANDSDSISDQANLNEEILTSPVAELTPDISQFPLEETLDVLEDNFLNIVIGEIAAAGPGCPEGSARLDFDPHGRGIGLAFDLFRVSNEERIFDRKACSIAMPLQIPQGFQIAMETPDLLTRIDLEPGATAYINVEAFFAGERGEQKSFHIDGPINEELIINGHDELNPLRRWSQCGDSLTLRINVSIRVQSSHLGSASASLLRLGSPEALLSRLQWRACHRQ